MTYLFLTGLVLFSSCKRFEIDNPEITLVELNDHIAYLASDSLKGREPGTTGGRLAAEYIRDQFKKYGYTMLEENGFQYFEVITEVEAGASNSMSINGDEGIDDNEYIPLSFSSNAKLSANVIFCGYGFDIDESDWKWNDYEGVDVKDQWALILRADPEPDNNSTL